MILRPRRCNEASREIFSEDSASPVRGSHRKKCADSKKRAASTECFGSTSISRTLSPPPQEHSEVESQRCKSSTSGRPLILFERSFSRCSNPSIGEKDQLKTLKTLSINDITSSAKLANPIVLMDRYEPPERSSATKSIRLNNSNDTLEQQTKLEQTSEDPSKETGAPKTPDTATASDTSTPPRHEKKQSTGKMRGCSDDGSSYEALPEEEKWTEEERQPITVKDASKTKTKSHNPTESQSSTCLPTGKKRKLSGRQTSKRSHLTADELKQESDSSKVVSQGHKRSSALPSKSYDSCGGTTAPKRKSKKCKMEEERGIDYYASLLWISDNISEHRKLHENWSIEELEASLRLRWNSLKKKEKAEYSARIQRIPHLPHLPRLSATLREINNSGKGSAQTQDSGHEGHSMNSQDSGREMKSNYRVGMTLDDGTFPHQRQLSWKLGERVPPPQEKKKEFNLKTLFASPGVVKKQIIKLIRQRISCSHCFLNLRQFLVSKLDESWERCITKGLHPPPHVPLCSFAGADVCPGSHLKDSFEPSLMPVSMSGRNSGMAEEKRRLKRFWSGRVWTLMEDLLEMMEAEMSKRKTCSCKFKMNKFKSKTYRGSAAEVEASADLQTDAGPLDDNDMEKDEVEVAMEILESWTKEGREKRLQNDAKLLEISVADERVIEEIKCSLMEFSDMVTRDKNLLEDNTLSLAAPDDDLRTHAFAHYADGDIRRASNSTKFQRKDPLRGHHGQAFGGCHDNFGRRMLSNRWDGFLGNDQGLPCGPGGFGDSPEKEVELMGASGKELDGVEMFPRQNVEFDSPDMHCRQYKPRYQLQFSRNMFSSKSPRCPNNINSNMNQDNNSNNNIDNNNNNNNHNSSNNNSNNDDNNNDNDNNSNNNWLHTNSNMNQNNNNLFLDSFWGLSQRPNLVLPSAISTRPSPVFLTLKPPPLPPMPPLPPTPPPSSGSGFYQNDGEYRSGKMDPDFTGDILANIMKEKSFSQNEQNFGIKQNQFFLKLSMKNSQS